VTNNSTQHILLLLLVYVYLRTAASFLQAQYSSETTLLQHTEGLIASNYYTACYISL